MEGKVGHELKCEELFLSGSKLTGKIHQCWCKIQRGSESSWLRLFKHLWHIVAQHKLLEPRFKLTAAVLSSEASRGAPLLRFPLLRTAVPSVKVGENIVSLSACLFAWCISFESTSIFSKCKNEQLVIPRKQQLCRRPLPRPERQTSLCCTRARAAHFSHPVHTTKYSVLQNKSA